MKRRKRKINRTGILFFIICIGITLTTIFCHHNSKNEFITLFDNDSIVNRSEWCHQSDNCPLHVPYLNQRGKYPTGCESVSAVMLLQYYGIEISVEDFIDYYLPKGKPPYTDKNGNRIGDDPKKCFLGNPYSKKGWGCYSPVIIDALEQATKNTSLKVKDLSKSSLEYLCQNYIDRKIPVMIWATIDMKAVRIGQTWTIPETGESFTWIYPMHVLVLTGYDENYYYFNDPWQKENMKYLKSAVEEAYQKLGQQAIAVVSEK